MRYSYNEDDCGCASDDNDDDILKDVMIITVIKDEWNK